VPERCMSARFIKNCRKKEDIYGGKSKAGSSSSLEREYRLFIGQPRKILLITS
jgi:hypothetical protein